MDPGFVLWLFAVSLGASALRGDIVPAVAGPVALGSAVGSLIGARVLLAVSNERVRLLFVVVLVAPALQMALSGFGIELGGPSE